MAKKTQFQKLKTYVKGLATRANKLVNQLKDSGEFSESLAVQEAMRSAARYSWHDQSNLFSTEGIKNSRQANIEKARILSFLSANTSRVKAANYEAKQIQAYETYHDAFFLRSDERSDITRSFADYIDEDKAKLAYRIYRQMEEEYTNIFGPGGYGSDNLIEFIYNEIESVNENDKKYETKIYKNVKAALKFFSDNSMSFNREMQKTVGTYGDLKLKKRR